MTRGALLDFGGTIDTDGIHWMRMFEMAYRSTGLPTDTLRDAYVHAERTLGRTPLVTPDMTFRDTLRLKIGLQLQYLGIDIVPNAEKILDFCYGRVTENIHSVSAPVLKIMSCRMPLVLVSNFYGNMRTVLQELGIADCFCDVVESSIVGVRKPDPEIFGIGVGRLGLEPGQVVAVGDSPDKDMIPAATAGCRTVWLAGKGWSEQAECRPDFRISSLRELPDLSFDD